MSVESGYSRYACDRSEASHPDGKKPIEFMTDVDKRVQEWAKDVAFVDVNGVTRHMTLCPQCAALYEKLRASQAADMQRFADQ